MIVIRLVSSGGVVQKIANSTRIKSKRISTPKLAFDAQAFLDTAGVARKVVEVKKAEVGHSQDGTSKSLMYLQGCRINSSAVNVCAKKAVARHPGTRRVL